jgi:DNA-binding IclR family transcriptional regulator
VARRAPAVDRSIAILNFLAAHPGDRFTLSEIARALDLNKATLHAILAALTGAGYLVRDASEKTYGLGPALIALGNSALGTFPAVTVAVPEMQALSDELELDCVGSAPIGDEIVILARTGARPFGINIQPGQRIPLVPPLGTVFVAWSPPEEIDRWLGKMGASLSKANRERYRTAIDAVRDRGYSVGLTPPREPGARRATVEESVKGLRDEYALVELDYSARYRVNHIGAPVFGPRGDVALALFLIGFHDQMPAEQVPRIAERLMAAAGRVTKAIHGREPATLG